MTLNFQGSSFHLDQQCSEALPSAGGFLCKPRKWSTGSTQWVPTRGAGFINSDVFHCVRLDPARCLPLQ